MIDAVATVVYQCDSRDIGHMLHDVDLPVAGIKRGSRSLNPRGFWRVDRTRRPELRHTVLTLLACSELESKIQAASGIRAEGIRTFLAQNDGHGWMVPETVRLADYALGHDDRARQHQPVAARFGPRFYDWQLAQTAAESWRECHLHARNLLGRVEYAQLLDRLIEHRILMGSEYGDLLFGDFTCGLVRGDGGPMTPAAGDAATGGGMALRAAEPKPGYSGAAYQKPGQAEMFPRPQTELPL